jgi:putative ABC transport system permease protein
VKLAYRNLMQDKLRFFISVSGVALAVMLILLLNGFLQGINQQVTSYLDHMPGTVMVAQKGVRNLLSATSLLPAGATEQARSVEGIAHVTPILSQFVILDLHEKKQPAYLIGYQPGEGGGPWKLSAGREPAADDEVIFDRVLAEQHEIEISSKVTILDQDFTVVGLSEGTTAWMTSFFFIRKSAAEKLFRVPGGSSFLLVESKPNADLERLMERLRENLPAEVQAKAIFVTNDRKLFSKVFSIPLKLMVAIAFLVGTLIIGLVIYAATIERQREYGVLKAIGTRNRLLYQVVALQAMISAVCGSALGVLLSWQAGKWIMQARPQFLIVFDRADTAAVVLLGLGMALGAALFPVRWIAGLAPAEVFRR